MENTLLQFTQNGMGLGDDTLGQLLAANYLKLILQEDKLPRFIAFYNGGVKLLCKDSLSIEALTAIEKKGVKLIACKTCLNHFKLLDSLEVGIAGTMIDIIELQGLADKVVNL